MIIQPKTVGVYLKINGLFAFGFGPNQHEGVLGITRFGGHIEEGETLVECALRELKEETGLEVTLHSSPVTFRVESWDSKLLEAPKGAEGVNPIFRIGQNVMFFAQSDSEPVISSETKGIIFLTEPELVKLCDSDVTYGEFVDWGGKSISKDVRERNYVLQPLAQMKLLARLIQERPEIAKDVYR